MAKTLLTVSQCEIIAKNSSSVEDYTKKLNRQYGEETVGYSSANVLTAWNNKNQEKSDEKSTFIKGLFEKTSKMNSFNTSVASYDYMSEQSEGLTFSNIVSAYQSSMTLDKKTGENKFDPGKFMGKFLLEMGEELVDILNKERILRNDINAKIGLTGELSKDFRAEMMESLPVVESMGYHFNDFSRAVISTMEQTGRFSLINQDIMERMAITSRSFIGDIENLGKFFRDFEMVGIGAENALDNIDKIGKSSLNIGLQSRKVVADIQGNLSKLNEYGFKNGVEGLGRMVQKSIEFRLSIDKVYALTDKVFNPEGAIELSANLQAIGGAIGDLNDPLKLMYMATNNVEGLQDAIIGVAGSLATYNTEQGRFEVTGVNLRKARALADQLGISYGELANTAIAAAERSSAAVDLLSSGLQLEDKEKEFLTNISRMEGGKMVIDIPKSLAQELGLDQTRVALENLDQNTASALLSNQKYFEKLSPEEIARGQYDALQQLQLSTKEIVTMLKVRFASFARIPLNAVGDNLKKFNEIINPLDRNPNAVESVIKSGSEEINSLFSGVLDNYIENEYGIPKKNNTSDSKLTIDHTFSFSNVNSDELVRILSNNPQFVQLFNDTIKKKMNQGIGGGYGGF